MKEQEKEKIVRGFYQEVAKANENNFHFWKEHTFLHWDWWLSFALAIIPWVIWWKFSKKETSARFMFSAFFIIIICSWLDFLGVAFGFWYYAGKVVPTIPSYIPWDFCILPVTMTLMMQFRPHFSPFKKAIFYSGIATFVGEPIFDLLGLYTMVHWKYIYSFPIYVIIYLCADWVSKRNAFGTSHN